MTNLPPGVTPAMIDGVAAPENVCRHCEKTLTDVDLHESGMSDVCWCCSEAHYLQCTLCGGPVEAKQIEIEEHLQNHCPAMSQSITTEATRMLENWRHR